MNLPSNAASSSRPDFITPIIGISGQYSLDNSSTVPYFFAAIEIDRLSSVLKTYDKTAASVDTKWQLTELYQRQIDPERINLDLVRGYLNLTNKLKFFNSLVVALLPKTASGAVCATFEDYLNGTPEIQGPDDAQRGYWREQAKLNETFGGVHFIKTDNFDISYLSWDRKRVDAIAVDGQHRLKALTEWVNSKGALSIEESKTRIPVIFLLLNEKAGYKHTGTQSIKQTAREIFTDLNKNAKKVDLATQIILDDRSIEARCVRSLLTDGTNEDSPDRLPLSLVRWKDHNIKFDSDYFINSVVGLYVVVDYLLDLTPPSAEKTLDTDAVKKYVDQLNQAFGEGVPPKLILPAGETRVNSVSLDQWVSERIIKDEEVQVPFGSMPPEFLDLAVERFEKNWRPKIVRLLREHEPYKNILDYAATENLYSNIFCQWHAQPETHQNELADSLEQKYGVGWEQDKLTKHKTKIEAFKKCPKFGERWAFKNLFQKAYLKVTDHILCLALKEDQRKYAQLDWLIKFFNALHKKDILCLNSVLYASKARGAQEKDGEFNQDELWLGISIHPSTRKIKATATGCDLMQRVFKVWYHASVYMHLNEATLQRDGFEIDQKLAKAIESEITSKPSIYPGGKEDVVKLKETLSSAQNARALYPTAKEGKIPALVNDRFLEILLTGLVVPNSLAKSDSAKSQ